MRAGENTGSLFFGLIFERKRKMKITFRRCDICNTKYEEQDGIRIKSKIMDALDDLDDYDAVDICPLCCHEIVDWLEELKDGRGED